MKHSEIRRDLTDNAYVQVSDDRFTGQFKLITHNEGRGLLASAITLRHSPTGWVDDAETYLNDRGFEVI